MNPCGPPAAMPVVIDNPCQMLPMLRQALYELMSGRSKAEVRFGDQMLRWHRGNEASLRAEIRRLETICGTYGAPNQGRAVQVGPRFNPMLNGYGRYRY